MTVVTAGIATGKSGSTRERVAPSWLFDIGVAGLILAPLFMMARKYSFPHTNHGEEVPIISALRDSDLFKNDFVVQSFLQPNPRQYYVRGMKFLLDTGLSSEFAYILVYWLSLTMALTALIRIGRISGDRSDTRLGWVSVLLILWSMLVPEAVGNIWSDAPLVPTVAIPATVAMPFALFGILAACRQRWIVAYALFGAASLLQFHVSFIPGFLLLPVLLACTRHLWPNAAAALAAWGIGLALIFVPLFLHELGNAAATADTPSATWIFGYIRIPHHWIPSRAGHLYWLDVSALILSGLLMAWIPLRRTFAASFSTPVAAVLVTSALCFTANYLFVEVTLVDVVAKLQFQRVLPFARLAIYIALAVVVVDQWRRGRFTIALALAAAPALEAPGFTLLALTALLLLEHSFLFAHLPRHCVPSLAAVVVAASVFNSWIPQHLPTLTQMAVTGAALVAVTLFAGRGGPYRSGALLASGLVVSAMAILLFSGTAVTMASGPTWRHKLQSWTVGNFVNTDANRIAVRFREISDVDDVLFLPPLWEFDLFQFYSHRAAFLNWKIIPMNRRGILEWHRRLSLEIGQPPWAFISMAEITRLYRSQPAENLASLARAEGIKFVLSGKDWHSFPNAIAVASEGRWTVWRLN